MSCPLLCCFCACFFRFPAWAPSAFAVLSPTQLFTFPSAQSSPSPPHFPQPLINSSATAGSCLWRWLLFAVWSFFPDPWRSHPQGGQSQRAETRPGRAWGWAVREGLWLGPSSASLRTSLAFSNQPSTRQWALESPHTPENLPARKSQKWTWMLCSSKSSSQRSRRGKRGASSNKVSPMADILWVEKLRWPR